MRLLLIYFTSKANINTAEAGMQAGQGKASPTRGGSATSQINPDHGLKEPLEKNPQPSADFVENDSHSNKAIPKNHVLFLNIDTGSNESIARTIVPGKTDEKTL
jgi:hypothetical protein